MDSDDREPIENQSIGDALMTKMIPQEDAAVVNGTVLSISLGDGKVSQNLISFMKNCTNIYLQCSEDGFQFIGTLANKNSKNERTSDKDNSMVFYLNFKKDKIAEYFFCPSNLDFEITGGKKTLTFILSMNQITNLLKKTKMKATTILRFDLNGRTKTFAMYIINGVSVIPYTLNVGISETIKDIIPVQIADLKITPNYKFSVELFYTMINAAAAKSDNVAYDFRLAIYKGGVAIKTDAPGIGPIPYGKTSENPFIFDLPHESTKYFGLIHKITPRATLLLTAVDDTVFKVSFPIGSCGEGFIFQFPKPNSAKMIEYQAQSVPVIEWQQQHSGWQQQYSGYTSQPSIHQNSLTATQWQPQTNNANQTQVTPQPVISNTQWQPQTTSSWSPATAFDASQYVNVQKNPTQV